MAEQIGFVRWPDPPLRDDDLHLRPWRHADAPMLVAAWNDLMILDGVSVPKMPTQEYAESWIAAAQRRVDTGTALDLVVSDDADSVLGEVGAVFTSAGSGDAEIGYWIGAEFRQRGYAQRAVGLFADWLLANDGLAMTRLAARTYESNTASARVLRATGFSRVDVLGTETLVWKRIANQSSKREKRE